MHVKVFSNNNRLELEETINAWLAEHPRIHIWFIRQTQDAGTVDEIGCVVITIWYEEKPQEKEVEMNMEQLKRKN